MYVLGVNRAEVRELEVWELPPNYDVQETISTDYIELPAVTATATVRALSLPLSLSHSLTLSHTHSHIYTGCWGEPGRSAGT